ncbi:RAD50-interacting protein 1 [Cyphellophora attinorum]|uniref:RAD50-interacting protein 1 n=1 Tax=Cyphellophora attinorum TaxID=1664694 RepID=A0A0N0NK92_9EURO|nr:RAD50-interacting protein 1 [Phialophora attinorum]KPI37559.1 RAD50-interacting protein 1 [Phialophora attinorum]
MTTLEPVRPTDDQRIDDYLDDQIGEARDLDGLDDLLLRVQEQQALLQSQLQDAQASLDRAKKAAEQHSKRLQEQAINFQKEQADLDRRLQEISYSSTTEEAVQAFDSRLVKLRRLELATNYLELLKVLDQLHGDVTNFESAQPVSAVKSYTRLREVSAALNVAQEEAEGSGAQIVARAEVAVQEARSSLRANLTKSFTSILDKMKWPQKEMNFLGGVLASWSNSASLLLDVQEADLQAEDDQTKQTQPVVLAPLQIMAEPLSQRFRFHFYGDRPTNRLDKPEYFLSHIFDLLDRFSPFMTDHLQPLLDARIDEKHALEDIYTDAVSSFISSLLPMVVHKCLSLLPQMSKRPQLLSHFISELMSFDDTLRDTWNYAPFADPLRQWKGLSWTILDEHGYFDRWLNIEKDFALERYKSIRDAADSGDVDYDGVDRGETKPTKGAIRVNDLLETITDRYRGLSSFSQKMKFVIGVQISIFDDYHAHLHESLQAYLASTHRAGRYLQGQYTNDGTFDKKALNTLCKIFGSAEFLERKMLDWSDDVFFVELWDELQERARGHSTSGGNVGKDLRLDEVAAKTSASIKQNGIDGDDDVDSGALFDETALAYRRLKEAAEREMLRLLEVNITAAIAPFARQTTWASMSDPPSKSTILSPSAALDPLLEVTRVLFEDTLSKVVVGPPLRRLVRQYCGALQTQLMTSVLQSHNFSTSGMMQMRRDVAALEDRIDASTGLRSIASSSFRKLNQAIGLLSLPIKSSARPQITESTEDGDDAWGFDEDGEEEITKEISPSLTREDTSAESEGWSLWDAEKELFRSNEAAREALADMGFDLLSEQEARALLKRRVELNS